MTDSSDISEKEIERHKRAADRPVSDVEGHRHTERHIEAPERHTGLTTDENLDDAPEVEGHLKRF